jgi:ubiquinol-cytochrome c reductase cytochrome c subunit
MRLVSAACCIVLLAAPAASGADVGRGRSLFVEGCASCHGLDARGIAGRGPSLHGAGAAAADFYLSTGRMPLSQPDSQPLRSDPAYPRADIDALVAYIGSLGGAGIPQPRPEQGRLNRGFHLYTEHCAGCHQIVGQGGVITGAVPPELPAATPTQIAEAIRVGPHVMPKFPPSQLSDADVNAIVRYVLTTRDPDDRGGWGIGHIGPIPEGMVAWLFAGVALVLVSRLIGKRAQ